MQLNEDLNEDIEQPMTNNSGILRTVLMAVAAIIATATTAPALAQRAPGSELDLLKREEIRQELELTEEQTQRIEELQKTSNPGREIFDPFLARMKEVGTEEERAKIREEMNLAIGKARSAFQEQAVKVLTDAQKKSLRSLFIRQAGLRALNDPGVTADLGLTAEQQQNLQKLNEERRTASRALGFNASDEERKKFETEWSDKALEVLTESQRSQWKELAAAAGEESASADGSTSSEAAASPSAAAASPQSPPSSEPPTGVTPVSSFGSGTPADNGDKAAAAGVVSRFSFNFRYAAWDQVLSDFALAAGYTLDLTVTPPGTFNHIDSRTYTAEQTLDIINGYLLRKGYVLVRKDGFLVCVNIDKGIDPSLIPDVSLEALAQVGQNEIVRIELAVENVDVAVMAQEVESLLGPQGKMTAFTQTGTLIVSDTGSNLRRIEKFLGSSLRRRKPDDLVFKSYHLKNLAAEEAEFMLLTQFGMRQGATNVSSGTESQGRDRDRRGNNYPAAPAPTSTPGLQVAADVRTNSLFVTGSVKQQTLVEEIIKAIDVSQAPDGTPLGSYASSGPYLKVYTVSGVDAGEITKSLDAMMPGVVINEDSRAGRIHIWGTSKQHEQVEEWIQQFDGRGGSGAVAVIPLVRMDPLTASATLRSLFLSEGTDAPTIETELAGRRLIVRGSAEQIAQIKLVLADLGEDGTGVRKASEGGNVRRFPLQGRSPEEFLRFLQQTWESSEPNRIRIIVPGNQGPIRERVTPSAPAERRRPDRGADDQTDADRRRSGNSITQDQHSAAAYLTVAAAVQGDDQSPEIEGAEADLPADSSSEASGGESTDGAATSDGSTEARSADDVRILVNGDELILSSADEAALDRMEEMIDTLQQTLPNRVTWTVFYLQAADATETATMLESIFPASSVSKSAASSSFSFGSMFRPVTDTVSNLTGLSGLSTSPQTLRIIPDIRSNSLFVTGPEMLIRDVEEVLKVLDAADLPESLRDMQPRIIEVRFADINDVAQIVNDVFKPYIESPAASRQQNNPLAALMGGGGKNGGDTPQVRMTVGVDSQNSSLIVSSSESLFTQVQQLVGSLDEAAQSANHQVRVVQLRNADAAEVQQSLSSLFPRVTSGTTKTAAAGNSESAGNTGRGSDRNSDRTGNAQQQDAFQQLMQERFRQRAQEAAGGGQGGDRGRGMNGNRGGGGFPFGGGNPSGNGNQGGGGNQTGGGQRGSGRRGGR